MTVPKVLLDPHFRRMGQLFPPEELARLRSLAEVVWGRDEPVPEEEVAAVRAEAAAVVTGGWRYGEVRDFPNLRAVLDVGGSFLR